MVCAHGKSRQDYCAACQYKKKRPRVVRVEVMGGVVTITKRPKGIMVIVTDHDTDTTEAYK